jgi:hypothetical protein
MGLLVELGIILESKYLRNDFLRRPIPIKEVSKNFKKFQKVSKRFKKFQNSKLTRKVKAELLNLALVAKLFLGPCKKIWSAVTRRLLQLIVQVGCVVGHEMLLPLRSTIIADLLKDLCTEPATGILTKNG